MTILYHGPAVSGKTTNLIHLQKKLACEWKGELHSKLVGEDERFIFFDSSPPEILAQHSVSQLRLQCVPGAIMYTEYRQELIRQANAVVFVADSQRARVDANKQMLEEMKFVLKQRGETLKEFPWVLQYNKRDLPSISSIKELEQQLNPYHIQSWEAVASQGVGIIETFYGIINRIIGSDPT